MGYEVGYGVEVGAQLQFRGGRVMNEDTHGRDERHSHRHGQGSDQGCLSNEAVQVDLTLPLTL